MIRAVVLRRVIGFHSSRHTPCAVRRDSRDRLRHTECAYDFTLLRHTECAYDFSWLRCFASFKVLQQVRHLLHGYGLFDTLGHERLAAGHHLVDLIALDH